LEKTITAAPPVIWLAREDLWVPGGLIHEYELAA
jgi:hypothetical protein